eukprot:3118359-Pyramimonas_sp.AAC.1
MDEEESQSGDDSAEESGLTGGMATGVMSLGWRVKYLLDWLLERPELQLPEKAKDPETCDGGPESPCLLSSTFSVQFDELGNPSLSKTANGLDLLPRQSACDELFGYSPPSPPGARKGRWNIKR